MQVLGLAVLLSVIVMAVYREAPGNQFHFDDYHNIVDYGPVRMEQPGSEALLDAFTNPQIAYRNVPSLLFALDWWRGGGEARAFLQTNVLLHILTALAVFTFAGQVLQQVKSDDRRAVLLAAFGVALLWAVHPVNSQAVNLIVQRMAILATLFARTRFFDIHVVHDAADHRREPAGAHDTSARRAVYLRAAADAVAWFPPALAGDDAGYRELLRTARDTLRAPDVHADGRACHVAGHGVACHSQPSFPVLDGIRSCCHCGFARTGDRNRRAHESLARTADAVYRRGAQSSHVEQGMG